MNETNDEMKPMTEDRSLGSVAHMVYLTPENAVFTRTAGGLVSLKLKGNAARAAAAATAGAKADDEAEKAADNPGDAEAGREEDAEREYPRVLMHRAFPFQLPDEFVSVLDPENLEIGLIRNLDSFPPETAALFREELERKYFCPIITKITNIKDRFGFSYWNCSTDVGEISFAVQDTYRNIIRITDTRVMILDVDGNRYEIPDVEALDGNSMKKIDVYL